MTRRLLIGGPLPRVDLRLPVAQFWPVRVPAGLPAPDAVMQTLEQIDLARRLVTRHAGGRTPVSTADGLAAALAAGRFADLIGVEGGHSIGGSLGVLRMFRQLGVRYLTLTGDHGTRWADSAGDVPRCGGLSEFGRAAVREMNRIGMLVDLSHAAATTVRDVLEVTRAPVVFSHSAGVPDGTLRRLARNGGVCVLPLAEATADRLEHLRAVAGPAHVGIGGVGCDEASPGRPDAPGYPRLFAELTGRGWSADELAALAGGNVLRVLRAADDTAAVS